MDSHATLGLESLDLQQIKPAIKRGKRRLADDGKKPKSTAIEEVPPGRFPATTPTYNALPIAPLGLERPTTTHRRKNFVQPHNPWSIPRYRPGEGFVSSQNSAQISRYQPGQGFTPTNRCYNRGPPRSKTKAATHEVIDPTGGDHNIVSAEGSTTKTTISPGEIPPIQRGRWHGSPPTTLRGLHTEARRASPPKKPKNKRNRSRKSQLDQASPDPTSATLSHDLLHIHSSQPLSGQANVEPAFPNLYHASSNAQVSSRSTPPKPASQSTKSKLSYRTKTPMKALPAPEPTSPYLTRAATPPTRLLKSQSLLLVLDLNGTLLHRPGRSTGYIPRQSLDPFLSYCLREHYILIWSSATPHNVSGICKQLFPPPKRALLLGEWGRDTLDLTPEQYSQRVQVYKRLSRVWDDAAIQRRHPTWREGGRWGQWNTVLIDDSVKKASQEPFNHVEVPEFAGRERKGDVLGQVTGWLEEARGWADVSGFVGALGRGFRVGGGWEWEWERGSEKGEEDGGVAGGV